MKKKIGIIGGGINGLAIGWQLAKRDYHVEILEKEPEAKGAAWVSAGMLAPQAELGFEEMEYFNLCTESLQLYPQFLEELYIDSGIKIKLNRCGTLMTAFDRDQTENLKRIKNFRDKIGFPGKWFTGAEAIEIEPLLSPKCTAALLFEEDAEVDNRKLITALKTALVKCGGELYESHKVDSMSFDNGLTLHFHGIDVKYDYVILCAGSWSNLIEGINLPDVSIRPIKGQIISLLPSPSFKLKYAVRNGNIYIVPKSDGRIIAGATVEDMGFDSNVTAGAVMDMLRDAWKAVPSVYELTLNTIEVGFRPGVKDNQPILGKTVIEGLFTALGHYRSGVLLAPITAYNISKMIAGEKYSDRINSFSISRFKTALA